MVAHSKMAGPPPPRPSLDRMHCSFQNCIEDIRVHYFDISKGLFALNGYMGTLAAMKDRQIRISPFLVNGVPVTPLPNPVSGFSSFFIIRLVDSTNPSYQVDLLFRDEDLYFVGFRRNKVQEENMVDEGTENESSEKQQKRLTGKARVREQVKMQRRERKAGWGPWHCFNERDLHLPGYFNATSCGISASYHEGVTPGGSSTFGEILLNLAMFDDGVVSEAQLRRSCFCVMVMLSEASRLRSVLKDMLDRVAQDMTPHPMSAELRLNITNWNQLGHMALDARLQGGCLDLTGKLDPKSVDKFAKIEDRKHKLETLGDIIDYQKGEVMLIKSDAEGLGFTNEEAMAIAKAACQQPNTGPAYRREIIF